MHDHNELFSERWPWPGDPPPTGQIKSDDQYLSTVKAYVNLRIAATAMAGTDGATDTDRASVWHIVHSLAARMKMYRQEHPHVPEVAS